MDLASCSTISAFALTSFIVDDHLVIGPVIGAQRFLMNHPVV